MQGIFFSVNFFCENKKLWRYNGEEQNFSKKRTMNSSPRYARFSDGERFPYLEDEDGLMSFWPTLYTVVNRRGCKAANTIGNDLAAISHLHLWEKLEQRNLLMEFSEQQFLTDGDIQSLRDHCHRDVNDLKRYMERAARLSVNAIELTAPLQSVSLQSVGTDYAYHRITVIAKYLEFCAIAILRARPNAGELNKRAEDMCLKMLATRPKGKKYRTSSAVHPPPQHFDEFMDVVAEKSIDNPYKSHGVRLRNFVMFKCFYETGMRSGELLSLYVRDVVYDDKGDPIIQIRDRRDDPNDPHPNPPQVKTNERDLPISQDLYDKIQEYITSVRYDTPYARLHPFVFVNHKHGAFQGRSMTDKNFQQELKRAVAVRPDRFKDVRKHGFRHNFNALLTVKMDIYSAENVPLTDKQRMDIRKDLNGWSSDASAEIYERGAVREKAKKAVRKLQDKQASVLARALKEAKARLSDE